MSLLGMNDMVQAAPPDQELADALANAESNLRNAAKAFFAGITQA